MAVKAPDKLHEKGFMYPSGSIETSKFNVLLTAWIGAIFVPHLKK